jgi:23S rRNA pseudouridine2605 synthase
MSDVERKSRRVGLARMLSKLGYCSRSRAVELIRAGRVAINGTMKHDPESPVLEGRDVASVDGREVRAPEKIYLMMNKPRGLVTTASDEKGRETVYAVLEKSDEGLPFVAPVGRLDKASEGLLLLTNDSEWAARIGAPETHLIKTYHVQVASTEGGRLAQALGSGVMEGGERMRAVRCSVLRSGEKNCWLEVVLDEGKNRQIRRMLSALGVEVLRLLRVATGPLVLGDLPKGSWRHLTKREKDEIDRALGSARMGRPARG